MRAGRSDDLESPHAELALSKLVTFAGCRRDACGCSRSSVLTAASKLAPLTPTCDAWAVSPRARSTAISLMHHTKNIPPFAFVGDWPAFAPLFLDGRVESSSFWKWHEG